MFRSTFFRMGIVGTFLALLVTTSAFGQGFMVKPMKIELTAKPGEKLETFVDLTNTTPDAAKSLELALVEITQSKDGSWLPVEKGVAVEVAKLSSCLSWTTIAEKTAVVKPSETGHLKISLAVPASARGYYFAGVVAQTSAPANARGIRTVIRFLIPLIVEIQGRPERQKIEFKDVNLVLREKDASRAAHAAVLVGVNNEGRTYSRITGNVKTSYFASGRWITISTTEIKEKGIIPGSDLQLPAELEKSLPSGKYKLVATLSIDGRRVKPLEKEIDFQGDPSVKRIAADTALLLDPAELTVAAAAGATRTSSISVQNASDEMVQVTATSLLPVPLTGAVLGNVKGDDYSCASWVEVTPAKFSVRGGGRQTVRVVARAPATLSQPGYFAVLSLKAQYEDGQSAGETQSLVWVENRQVTAVPAGQILKTVIAGSDPSKYMVTAKCANIGNCRIGPSATASLLGPDSQPVASVVLSGLETQMLPLESRALTGELDLSQVAEGNYTLRTSLTYGANGSAAEMLPIRVSTENGQKVMTLVDRNVEPSTTQAGAGK